MLPATRQTADEIMISVIISKIYSYEESTLYNKKVTLNALSISLPLKHNQNPHTQPPIVSYTRYKKAPINHTLKRE